MCGGQYGMAQIGFAGSASISGTILMMDRLTRVTGGS